jgi:hypothetical protein
MEISVQLAFLISPYCGNNIILSRTWLNARADFFKALDAIGLFLNTFSFLVVLGGA